MQKALIFCFFLITTPLFSQTTPESCFDFIISADEAGENVATLRCARIPIFKFKSPGTYGDLMIRAEEYKRRLNAEISTNTDLTVISFDLKKIFAVTAATMHDNAANDELLYEIIPEDLNYYSNILQRNIQAESIGAASIWILRDILGMIIYKMPPSIIGDSGDDVMKRVFEGIDLADTNISWSTIERIVANLNESDQIRLNKNVFYLAGNAGEIGVRNTEFQSRLKEFINRQKPLIDENPSPLKERMREIRIYFANSEKALKSGDINQALEPLESIKVLVPSIADQSPPVNTEQITQFIRYAYTMELILDGIIKNIKNNMAPNAISSITELKSTCNNCHQLFGSNYSVE